MPSNNCGDSMNPNDKQTQTDVMSLKRFKMMDECEMILAKTLSKMRKLQQCVATATSLLNDESVDEQMESVKRNYKLCKNMMSQYNAPSPAAEMEYDDSDKQVSGSNINLAQMDQNYIIMNVKNEMTEIDPVFIKSEVIFSQIDQEDIGENDTTTHIVSYIDEGDDDDENDDGLLSYPTECEMVLIGEKSLIPKDIFDNIKWSDYHRATNKLLTSFFKKKTLGTRTLTGQSSHGMPPKGKLNPSIIKDVVSTIMKMCHITETKARAAITKKCNTESTLHKRIMYRMAAARDAEENQ